MPAPNTPATWPVHTSLLEVDVQLLINLPMADGKGSISWPKTKGRIKADLGETILFEPTPVTGAPSAVEQIPKAHLYSIRKESSVLAAGSLVLPGAR